MEQREDLKQLTILLSEDRSSDPLLGWGAFLHLGLSVLLGTIFVVGTVSYSPGKVSVQPTSLAFKNELSSQSPKEPTISPVLLSTTMDIPQTDVVPSVLLPDFSLPPDAEDEYHEELPKDVYHFPEPKSEVDNTALLFPMDDQINDVTNGALIPPAPEPLKVFGPQLPTKLATKPSTKSPVTKKEPVRPKKVKTIKRAKVSQDTVVATVAQTFDGLGFGVDQEELSKITVSSELPRWMSFSWLVKKLGKALGKAGVAIASHIIHRDGPLERLSMTVTATPPLRLRFHKKLPRARVAVIVDDIGFGGHSTGTLLSIKAPLTLAILPFCRGSKVAAETGVERSYEVILHMPMEPSRFRNNVRAKVAVFIDMNSKQIKKRLVRALDSLPGLSGLNNHMGSLFTEKAAKLDPVMSVLKERKLYFVDSVTTRHSVAFTRARRLGLPSGRRNFEFIDNKPGFKYSQKQFKRMIARTKSKKALICIMHDRKHSVNALVKMLGPIRAAGIELTYASELLEGGKGEKAKVAHRLQ